MDVRVFRLAVSVAGQAAFDLTRDLDGELLERLGRRGLRIQDHDRLASVAANHHLAVLVEVYRDARFPSQENLVGALLKVEVLTF